MQRQKSILSFFQKPSATQGPDSVDPTRGGGGLRSTAKEGGVNNSDVSVRSAERNVPKPVDDDVRGVDTPPEKVPRRVLPSNFKAAESAGGGGGASSLFSSIMHKFVKVDGPERSRENVAAPLRESSGSMMPESVFPERRLNNAQTRDSVSGRDNLRSVEDEDVLGPDTPGTRPSVPRLKRVLEDGVAFTETKVSLFDNNKRMKLLCSHPSMAP